MEQPKSILFRASLIYFAVVLLGLCILMRVVMLQFNNNLKEKGLKVSYREEELSAKRGDILAHDGRILATSLPHYQIYMDCVVPDEKVFNDGVKKLAASLSGFFGDKPATSYEKVLRDGRKSKQRYVKLGNRKVSYTELQRIRKFPIFELGRNKGGCISEEKNVRKNAYNKLAFRTIGWTNEGGVGVGIEGAYNYALKGMPGQRTVQKIAGGDWMPVNSALDVMPRNGYDVLTTLDVDIQDAAETALREQLVKAPVFEAGTAIIMEVETGEIRAIANMKRMPGGSYSEAFNYAIGQATEPGSTFKLPTLIALLEDGLVELDQKVNTESGRWVYKGNTFRDVTPGGYGEISIREVFEKSSNIGFAKLAIQYYLNNERQYVDKLYAMKLNEKLGLQIPGEASPQIRYTGDKHWSGLSLPMMSMGYEVMLTPIMILTLYNAVANGGRMVKPKFVSELKQGGDVKKKFPTEVISSSICSRTTLEKVNEALLGVVENGTAKSIYDNRYKIAGKTGTARIVFDGAYEKDGYRMHQASFVGFFPADNPKYTGVVVLYTEKTRSNFYGGTWAAPVFKQIADKIYVSHPEWVEEVRPETGTVMLADVIKENTKKENPKRIAGKTIPSVVGMTLKDALYLLENMGLSVSFSGAGHVILQSLPAGTKVTRGQGINLELR
jgi:cell division protein FtsI (penicillin-binding protein 3)